MASRRNKHPNQVYHVSVMPCYDKKLEASRPDFYHQSYETRDVDCVITSGQKSDFWFLIVKSIWLAVEVGDSRRLISCRWSCTDAAGGRHWVVRFRVFCPWPFITWSWCEDFLAQWRRIWWVQLEILYCIFTALISSVNSYEWSFIMKGQLQTPKLVFASTYNTDNYGWFQVGMRSTPLSAQLKTCSLWSPLSWSMLQSAMPIYKSSHWLLMVTRNSSLPLRMASEISRTLSRKWSKAVVHMTLLK